MTSARGAGLVVNGRARSGELVYERARERLQALGVGLRECHLVRDPAVLGPTVEGVVANCGLVIVGGGDGTLSSVSGIMARAGATLGVIPLGTANDFARTLGIPSELEPACALIADGNVVEVDLGRAGDDSFLNVASVGFGAAVAAAMSPRAKKVLGPAAYALAATRAAGSVRPFSVELCPVDTATADGPAERFDRVVQVAVGNGRYYGGGRQVSPTAGVADAALDVLVIRWAGLRELVGVTRRLRSGDFAGLRSVSARRTPSIELRTDPPMPVNLDGELRSVTPLRFAVDPGALRVLAPAAGPGPTGPRNRWPTDRRRPRRRRNGRTA